MDERFGKILSENIRNGWPIAGTLRYVVDRLDCSRSTGGFFMDLHFDWLHG